VRESFSNSVLWSGEIIASDKDRHLVDFSSFLLADRHGIAGGWRRRSRAPTRSTCRAAPCWRRSQSLPGQRRTGSAADLCRPGRRVRAPGRRRSGQPVDAPAYQHGAPAAARRAWRPRTYHPYSGGFDTSYFDFATPLASSIDVHWQVRHKLEKTDPSAAVSTVKNRSSTTSTAARRSRCVRR
jgi:hypothetical protein